MKTFTILLFILFTGTVIAGNFPGYIENKGQIIDQFNQPNNMVKFLFTAGDLRVQLREAGFSYEVVKYDFIPDTNPDHPPHYTQTIHRIDINWMGASSNIEIEKHGRSNDYINYHTTGTSNEGVSFVHYYQRVVYKNVYENIDFEFILDDGNPKYNIIVRPGGNPSNIQLNYLGSDLIKLENNKLIINTSLGNIEDNIPLSYQDGTSGTIDVEFVEMDENIFGFDVLGEYNQELALIIDPVPAIVWATYYGGFGADISRDIIEANNSNLLICGHSSSTTNIATAGAYLTVASGSYDVMLMEFDTSGVRQWATYYGGAGEDYSYVVDQDSDGEIYLVGQTSSVANIAAGGFQNVYGNGGYDAFLVKFSVAGLFIWGSYYGGTDQDLGYGLVVDGNDNIIITGWAGGGYAVGVMSTAGAHQPTSGGAWDAFLAKFDGGGNRLWGTYFGGGQDDRANLVTVDNNNNIYLTGETRSPNNIAYNNFHMGAFQGGTWDAFLSKFDPNGTIVWSSYIGGTAEDRSFGVEYDGAQHVVITGHTYSNTGFSTAGAYQLANNGGGDGFICRFDLDGNISWKTYFGGAAYDRAYRLDIDNLQNIYASGQTASAANIATNGFQNIYGTNSDAFVALLDPTGNLQWSSYYGGSASDDCWDIHVMGNGYPTNAFYMVGQTNSAGSISTPGSHQPAIVGGTDAYIAKIFPTVPLPVELSHFSADCKPQEITFSWSTTAEINNDYYTIEKSNNAIVWEEVASVIGAGNSNSINQYGFNLSLNDLKTDEQYFRLRQTDFNGIQKIYSPVVVSCDLNPSIVSVDVFPNPSSGYITVQSSGKITGLWLMDINGKILISNSDIKDLDNIDVSFLENGIYTLCIKTDDSVIARKIVKQ